MTRRIALVSVGRSDRGHLQPLVDALGDHAHLLEFGRPVADDLPLRSLSDTPTAISLTGAQVWTWFARAFDRVQPDLVVVFGDRYEQLAAALAATVRAIPIAHLHGGETTAGAYDNQVRHAITKLAHLHFVSHRRHGAAVYRMGEARWRIHVTGAPGLDRIPAVPAHSRDDLAALWKIDADKPWIIVTLHPCTLDPQPDGEVADAMVAALREFDAMFVVSGPGPDVGNHAIGARLSRWVGDDPRAVWPVPSDAEYLSLMAHAACMVGNSSSGIIEAPTLGLPVVNIGRRQAGRLRAGNVYDVGATVGEITVGIDRALYDKRPDGDNPYGDGHAAERIAAVLLDVALDRRLREKR